MASGEESVDLSVEARIAGSNRRRVPHGWAMLRQVNGLRDVASAGRTDELSPKPDPRPLNSRALAGKCQLQGEGWLKIPREGSASGMAAWHLSWATA
jgi:hypothetical protein